jgi:hypothetical protein
MAMFIVVQLYTITKRLMVIIIDVICRRVHLFMVVIRTTAVFEAAIQVFCPVFVCAGNNILIGRNGRRSNGGHTIIDSQRCVILWVIKGN